MINVKIIDREKEVEFLRMALNMCELGVSYTQADLIVKVSNHLNKKQGQFNLEDGVHLFMNWKSQWDEYKKNQEENSDAN